MRKNTYSTLTIPDNYITAEYPNKFDPIGPVEARNNEILYYNKVDTYVDMREEFDDEAQKNMKLEQGLHFDYHHKEDLIKRVFDFDSLNSSRPTSQFKTDSRDLDFMSSGFTAVAPASSQHSADYRFTQDRGFLPVSDYTKDYISDIEYAKEEPTFMRNNAYNEREVQVETRHK